MMRHMDTPSALLSNPASEFLIVDWEKAGCRDSKYQERHGRNKRSENYFPQKLFLLLRKAQAFRTQEQNQSKTTKHNSRQQEAREAGDINSPPPAKIPGKTLRPSRKETATPP